MNSLYRLFLLLLIASTLPALGQWGQAVAPNGVILKWGFDDQAGTHLHEISSTPTQAPFHKPAKGIETNGQGQLVVRPADAEPRSYYAELPDTVKDQPVWLVAEIDAWNITNDKWGQGVRFGIAAGRKLSEQLADIRLNRDSQTRLQLSGRAGGGGDPFLASRFTPLPIKDKHTYALYYDYSTSLYAIFSKERDGRWEQRGTGKTDPGRGTPKFARIVTYGYYGDADEALLVGSLTLQTNPPAPGLVPEFVMPNVTADAWAVADATTGAVIAAKGLDEKRHNASITKVMAAYTVLALAEQNPEIWNERIQVSQLAADTKGSSADLEAGESVMMTDALYGLLLPSGNDIGNALAEHFSSTLPNPTRGEDYPSSMETRKNFVSEMRRNAKRLGMKDTVYRIPYGDGGLATQRTTTVADLLKLADAAMKSELFRTIVSTQQYTATVLRPDGSTRYQKWENTNEFLGEPGFVGIKTGSTSKAGACILAAYVKNGIGYYILVLNSDGSDQRYKDVRILIDHYLAN